MILRYIAAPAVGAVIGYCTNYLAVKMLFLPRTEKRIFGHRVPFTPGAIPRGKPRLARAVGEIISTMLLTQSDLSEKIASSEVCSSISERIFAASDKSVKETISQIAGSAENYEVLKEKTAKLLAQKILDAALEADFTKIIEEEGVSAVREKLAGSMMAMFVNEEMIRSFIAPLSAKLKEKAQENGFDFIKEKLLEEFDKNENESIFALLSKTGLTQDTLKDGVSSLLKKVMPSLSKTLSENLDIARLIEDKMNAMDVMELEHLVLSVMKKELDTIVNLGALIGAVLGAVNIFF